MTKEITLENLKTLEIKQIALDKNKFGALTFDGSYLLLHKLRKMFVEFDELSYREFLTQSEIGNIDNYKQRLLEYIKRIYDIHPEEDASFNKDVRDRIENEIEDFYNSTIERLRNNLTYLRQEAALKGRDEQDLQERQKAVLQAEKEYKELSRKLEQELKEWQKQKQAVETEKRAVEMGRGEVASKTLAKHFAKQANDYTESTGVWLGLRDKLYKILTWIIVANFSVYFAMFFLNKFEIISLSTKDIFTIEYGIIKLALLSIISYGIAFASKNYNVNSNLEVINRHRKNIAQTLDDFLATNPGEEIKSQMIRQGTEAMFKHLPIGYISKINSRDDGPIHEIVNKIIPFNKE